MGTKVGAVGDAAGERDIGPAGSRAGWAGWAALAVVLAGGAVVTLTSMESGVDDPRLTNPNPGSPPYEPFLGVSDWPAIANTAAGLSSGVFLGVLLWLSARQRRLHWGVIVFLAVMSMGVLDPIANWATFTVFDPRIGHFPLDWPWMRFAPMIEPAFSFLGGYACYYFGVGLVIYWLYQRLVLPRIKPGSWADRRPLLALSLTSFMVSIPIDVLLLYGWLRLGIIVFLEGVGPIVHLGDVQIPVGMVLYDSWPFLLVPLLCHRDAQGRSVVLERLATLLPSRSGERRATSGRQLVGASVLMVAAALVPFGLFAGLRVTHQFRPSYGGFPFPELKVYDPYGDLEDAGKTGPFYR